MNLFISPHHGIIMKIVGQFVVVLGAVSLVCGNADVSYIIDSSGSIGDENWPGVINFFKNLTMALDVGQDSVRIGAVKYGDKGEMMWPLNACHDQQCVLDKLDNMIYIKGSSTNTSGAFFVTWNELYSQASGNRSEVKDLCILFTDGMSNLDENLTIPYANELKARGCALFVVAIGNDTDLNLEEIEEIASEPKLNFTLRSNNRNFTELIKHVKPIVKQTTIELQKSDPCRTQQLCQRGAVCTNLDPNAQTYSCDCRDSFKNQPTCDDACPYPDLPPHTRLIATDLNDQGMALFGCEEGYAFVSGVESATTFCQNFAWMQQPPECKIITDGAGPPPSPAKQTGLIAGIAVGLIALIAAGIIITLFLLRKMKKKKYEIGPFAKDGEGAEVADEA